jgi:hypothetical protein
VTAWADRANFGYDYLDLGHVAQAPQNGNNTSSPYGDLSYSIIDGLQLRASYSRLDTSATPGAKGKDYTLGLTGEAPVDDLTDIYTDLLYVNDQTTDAGVSTTTNGYRLAVGLRHRLPYGFELDGYLAHNYLDTPSNEAGLVLLYDATSWLSVGIGYAHDSSYTNTTTLKLRLYF